MYYQMISILEQIKNSRHDLLWGMFSVHHKGETKVLHSTAQSQSVESVIILFDRAKQQQKKTTKQNKEKPTNKINPDAFILF